MSALALCKCGKSKTAGAQVHMKIRENVENYALHQTSS